MAEGEFALAKTSVWWDIENCAVPTGFDAHNIAQNISAALANEGYRGETEIAAYGDTSKINNSVQHALNSAGVNLNHVPAGVKDGADKKILVDMFVWAFSNPPPANYLLISGDRDFSNALHKLRLKGYNILLAHLPNVSQALVAAAKYKWLWSSLVAGGPSRNADSSLKSSATDTDSGNSSEGIEETQNAHGNGNPTKAPKKSKRPIPGMQDKRNGSPENNNGKANQKQQTDQVSATDEVSEAHSNAESSLKSGATDTDSGIPSECFEQTQNAHENGNHADRQLVKLTFKAPKKSKPPTPWMQDKRNGSCEKNNTKSNEKKQADQVSATDEVSEAHSNAESSLKSGATDTDLGVPSECFEQTQNAHENGNHADRQLVKLTSKAPKKSKPPTPWMQDKRNGSCEKNNTKSNEKKQADQVSATDEVSEAHSNAESSLKSGATDTDLGVPSECFEQTQNAHENGNHADRQLVKLTSKAPKKSKPPTPWMQDKRNGSCEKNNTKSNEKKQADQVSSTDHVSEAHGNDQSKNNAGPMTSTSSSTSSEFPSNSDNNQARPGPALRPNEKNLAQPPFAPPGNLRASSSQGNNFYPQQRGTNSPHVGFPPPPPQAERPPFRGPSASSPDISQLNRSEHPIGVQQRPISHQHNLEVRPGFSGKPQNSNQVQHFGHFRPGRPGYLVPPPINGNTFGAGFSKGQAFPTKAPKKSKRPTPGMQYKRNGSPESNNLKANQKQQTDQLSAPDQVSEAHGNAQSKYNTGSMTSTSSSTSSEFPSNSGINQVRLGPELRPSEKNPAQPPFTPPGNLRASSSLGNSFFPQTRGTSRPPFKNPPQSPQAERLPFCGPSPTLPDISRLNMSEHPIAVQQRPIPQQHHLEIMARFSDTPPNSNQAQNFGNFPPGRPEYLVPPANNGNTYDTGFSGGQAFPTNASKKSKRPTPGMQDKRNGSCEKNNTKSNEKKQADQVSSTDQVSEAHGNGQSKNNAGPMTSTSSSTSSEFPSNSSNNQARPGPALRPNEKNLAQPPFAPPGNLRASSSQGNNFYPQPRGTNSPHVGFPPPPPQAERPPFRGPSASSPDISQLNRSEHPIGVQQRPISHQHNLEVRPGFSGKPQNSNQVQHFGHFRPGRPGFLVPPANNGNTGANNGTGFSGGLAFPGPTPELQFHIDTILHALRILRMDKMAPTETNIGDCILFSERKHPGFNVRLGLDCAMRYGMIVEQFGYYLPLYIPKNGSLWDCINIMDANARHPKETWGPVQKYMSSRIGRDVLLHTTCRYEAALVLRTNCFKDHIPLGIVLQILQLTIVEKWVVPHSSGWQPIAINPPPSQMK